MLSLCIRNANSGYTVRVFAAYGHRAGSGPERTPRQEGRHAESVHRVQSFRGQFWAPAGAALVTTIHSGASRAQTRVSPPPPPAGSADRGARDATPVGSTRGARRS